MNIGVGSILTNGLGGSAYNLLTFGPFNLYIEPLVDPDITPTPTPTITPLPIGGGGGGRTQDEDQIPPSRRYKLILTVRLTKRKTVTREFIVDRDRKDILVKRIGKINTLAIKFKVVFKQITGIFKSKWKK